jgi:hypothetical protein
MLQCERIFITPEIAKKLLANNPINRPPRSGLVEFLASQMSAGEWRENGESIIISESGELLDGQHRLMACVKSGHSFWSVVSKGVYKEYLSTIDTGDKKTVSDHLSIAGEVNASALAAVIRLVRFIDADFVQSKSETQKMPTMEAEALIAKYPLCRESVSLYYSKASKVKIVSPKIITAVRTVAGTRLQACGLGTSTIDAFCDSVLNPASIEESDGNPLWTLFKMLKANSVSYKKIQGCDMLKCIIKSWNNYHRGSKLRLIRFSPGASRASFEQIEPLSYNDNIHLQA